MIGNEALAAAWQAEHERKIAENPTTITVARETLARNRGGKTPSASSYGPVTVRCYFERTVPAYGTAATGPGPIETGESFSILFPVKLDDGVTDVFPDPNATPNDPDITDTFTAPSYGTARISHVEPLRAGGVLFGWRGSLELRR